MKITILQSDFLPTLLIGSRFVTQRAQLPILGNIKLEAKGAKLIISATNLEMSVSTSIGAKVEKEGQITLPAKTLTDLVSNISDSQINIESDLEKVKISSENTKTTLTGTNAADFPEIMDSMPEKSVSLDTKEFIEALPQVAFCSSPDDTRPALSGVLLIFDTDISLVASDGYRLSKRVLSQKSDNTNIRYILPKNLVSELLKIIKDPKKKLLHHYSDSNKQVVFSYDNYIISSRIVDGEYPNFEKIIPASSKIEATLSKSDLTQALKVISVIARESANIAEFNFDEKSVVIKAESNKSGEGETFLDANVTGGKLSILFNYKFLLDFLNSIEGDSVLMQMNDSSSAGVFKDASQKNYLHLVMPVKL